MTLRNISQILKALWYFEIIHEILKTLLYFKIFTQILKALRYFETLVTTPKQRVTSKKTRIHNKSVVINSIPKI